MWSAFKSDLLDFVNTITEDTSKTLASAIGENEDADQTQSEEDIRQKLIKDLQRSFLTYSKPVEESFTREYDKYSKTFSLSTYAADIATILDQEVDVARFYAELVPIEITPEMFWSRYFFKVMLIDRNGAVDLDDDDEEEEMQWESSEPHEPDATDSSTSLSIDTSDTSKKSMSDSQSTTSTSQSSNLGKENEVLRGQVRALVNRISELEKTITTKDEIIAKLQNQIEALNRNQSTAVPTMVGSHATNPNQSLPSGTLTSSSSFTMLETLSDAKSDESVVLVGNGPVKSISPPYGESLDHHITPVTPINKSVSHPMTTHTNTKPIATTNTNQGKSSTAVSKPVVSLDEDEDDGWT